MRSALIKRRILAGLSVVGLGLLLCPAPVLAADDGGPTAEEIAAWKEAISPGAEHHHLDSLIGAWDAKVLSWESPDQAEPMVSTGSAKFAWILGGRYVEQHFFGTFMEMPFEGRGFIGYDKAAGHYTSIWMDNFSTGIMREEGSCNADGTIFSSKGSYVDSMTGKETALRSEHRVKSPDKHVLTMYLTGPDGNEFKMMEIVYTRKR